MTTTSAPKSYTPIDPATTVGLLALSVADLQRSVDFYTGPIGLALLAQDETSATLGVAGQPLLLLNERRGAAAWPRGGRSYTGLYHFAILLPTQAALGAWLRHWLELGLPVPGQGDHLVSEALYLEDPDGHGIEIYRDRPRDSWKWRNGQVQMATDPVDLRGLLNEAARVGGTWQGLPAGTHLGHMHLQVGDIPQAAAFYRDILGFDIVAAMPTALFVSAGGYHHHIGMNIWHSQGATQAPEDSVRLRFFTIDLPNEAARTAVVERLTAADVPYTTAGGAIVTRDPWDNTILLQVGAATDADTAAALVAAAE
jgi:catechol 2,3-dioxygenase